MDFVAKYSKGPVLRNETTVHETRAFIVSAYIEQNFKDEVVRGRKWRM